MNTRKETQGQDFIRDEDIKHLVIARLEAMPPNIKISIGSQGDFSRDELIQQVEQGTEIGEQITRVQLEYLRSLKEGVFYGEDE